MIPVDCTNSEAGKVNYSHRHCVTDNKIHALVHMDACWVTEAIGCGSDWLSVFVFLSCVAFCVYTCKLAIH